MSEEEYTHGSQHGNPPPAPESHLSWWLDAEIARQQAEQAARAAKQAQIEEEGE